MKKQQLLVIGGGVVLFCLLYFFGRTVPHPVAKSQVHNSAFNIDSALKIRQSRLTASQIESLSRIGTTENDASGQIKTYQQMAAFWRDSIHDLLSYAYYTSRAAQLENSEKSLTFAAHYFLESLRRQSDPALRSWMAKEARQLFEKALAINPNNDSLKVGLGSSYLFGNIDESPMQGVQMIREVAERDSTNMYAQLMLGYGAMISGQLDKAAERLEKVVLREPQNLEAVLLLAEAHEQKGEKESAIRWYEAARNSIRNPEVIREIDKRISLLKSK